MKFFGLVLDHVSRFVFLVVSDCQQLALCRVMSDSEDGVDAAMLSPTAHVDKGLPSSSSCNMVSTDAWDWTETVSLTQWEHWFAMDFQDECLEALDPSDSPRSKMWKAAQQSQFFAWSLHGKAAVIDVEAAVGVWRAENFVGLCWQNVDRGCIEMFSQNIHVFEVS